MGDILPNSPDIQKPELQQHEIVLRLFVTQLNTGYKDGWLYYKCKEKDLLSVYNEYRSKGFFNLLKSNAKDGFDKPKLTIELVPKTCWFSNVESNVTPSQWNKLKKISSQEANHRCKICGGKGPKWPVECHEIWEYDDSRLVQTLKGLISLCPSCHSAKHMGFAQLCGREVEITCHLAIVNKWSYEFACEYISEQFKVWENRSKYTWLLDISWLEQHGILVENQDRIDTLYTNINKAKREYFLNNRKAAIDHFNQGANFEKSGNYKKAYSEYLAASNFGDFDAAYNLAIFYSRGNLGEVDLRKSWYYLKKAACLGDKQASTLIQKGKQHFERSINKKADCVKKESSQLPEDIEKHQAVLINNTSENDYTSMVHSSTLEEKDSNSNKQAAFNETSQSKLVYEHAFKNYENVFLRSLKIIRKSFKKWANRSSPSNSS